MSRERLRTGLEIGTYLACALFAVCSAFGKAVGTGTDMWGTLWYQEWIAHCARELVNPSWTPWLFHPVGEDIFAHTGNNFVDMVVGLPFHAIFGSPGYMAPTVALILFGNALAMRALLRSLFQSRLAILAGCLVFELHPFVLHELNGGRMTQALLWFWPLALRELFAMDRDRRWRRPLLGGLFLFLQALTYWYTGHIFLLVMGPLLLLYGWRRDRGWWLRLALAAAVAAALAAPFVVTMMARIASGAVMGADAEALAAFRMAAEHHRSLPLVEKLGVLPWRGYLLLVVVLAASRRRLLWLLPSVVGLLAMLGPGVALFGQQLGNPLWAAAEAMLPGFQRFLFPERFWAALALIATLALAEAMDARLRRRSHGVLALAAALALGIAPIYDNGSMVVPTAIARPAYVDVLRQAPGIVLDLPFPCTTEIIHYQGLHRQPLLGGMADGEPFLRPPGFVERVRQDPLVAALIDAAAGLQAQPVPLQGEHSARWVVVHVDLFKRGFGDQCWKGPQRVDGARKAEHARGAVARLLGPPQVEDDWAVAWDLQAIRRADKR